MAKDRTADLSELLSAYLDGELDEATRAEVVAYLDRDAGAVQLLNELRETRSMLQDLPHQSAPAGFSDSVVSAVERRALLGGADEPVAPTSAPRRWRPIRAAASIVLLVGVAGTWIYWQSDRRAEVAGDFASHTRSAPEASVGRAAGNAVEPAEALAMADDAATDTLRSDGPRVSMKKSTRGKGAAPLDRSEHVGTRVQTADTEFAEQRQEQSIAALDETKEAGIDLDDEVIALGIEPEMSTDISAEADAEEVNFGLALRLRGARRGGAARPDFLRRLAADEPAVALASHDFSSESNALTLNFASDAQRAEFANKFEHYLKDNSFLSAADPIERVQVADPLTQNVVLRGRQGLNYLEPSGDQILLNAAPEVLEGLIDRYAATTGGEDTTSIELQVGDMKVQGLEKTREIARAMAVPELQALILGEEVHTADALADAAADRDEQRTAAQWHEHYARLHSAGEAKQGQAVVGKDHAAEQAEDEEDQVAAAEQHRAGRRGVASVPPPARKTPPKEEAEAPRKDGREEQAVAAGEEKQDEDDAKKRQHRARSAKRAPDAGIELFGRKTESPPAADPADDGSGGRGAGGDDTLEPGKRLTQARQRGRASNLTFVLKLQTVPPVKTEPEPEMGPPAPPPEPDDSEE